MKRQTRHLMLLIAVVTITIASCKKETATNNNATSNLSAVFTQAAVASQSLTADAGAYSRIIGNKGTIINIFPGSLLHQNGTAVTGLVNIDLKEIYGKGNMVLSNATTTSNGLKLESGGEVFLQASQNGEVLRINHSNPLAIEMPTNNALPGMQLFRGRYVANSNILPDSTLNWDTTAVHANVIQDSVAWNSAGTFYSFQLDSFGWSNCDRFYNLSGGTAVQILTNGVYNNHNTAVFLIFNAEQTAAGSDRYDSAAHIFGFHSDGHTPLGLAVTIVAISQINGQYYSSIIPTTTTANMMVTLNFQPTTLAAFTSAVSAF